MHFIVNHLSKKRTCLLFVKLTGSLNFYWIKITLSKEKTEQLSGCATQSNYLMGWHKHSNVMYKTIFIINIIIHMCLQHSITL